MKKFGALVVAVVFLAAGCDNSKSSESATSAASAPVKASVVTPPAAKAADSTGVPECDAYMKALEKFLACEKVPQAARDAQKQSAQQMRNSWASWAAMPPDARKTAQAAAATSCSTALTALKQAAAASGCPVE